MTSRGGTPLRRRGLDGLAATIVVSALALDIEDARRGFALRNGHFTKIDPPGSLFTLPSGIDDSGRIVGGYLDPNGVNGRGFLWNNGRYTTIVARANGPTRSPSTSTTEATS
jgi:hypothetical protein